MPNHEDDYDKARKQYDEVFTHVKELYKYEVTSHVVARMTAIGGALLTAFGIAGYFGLTNFLQSVEDDFFNDISELTSNYQVKLENTKEQLTNDINTKIKEQISNELKKLEEMEIEARVASEVAKRIGKELTKDFSIARENLRGMNSEIEDATNNFNSLKTNIKNSQELNQLDTLDSQKLAERIETARVTLNEDPDNAHEKEVLGRSVQQLGIREFKGAEREIKIDTLDILRGLLEKEPGKTKKGENRLSLEPVSESLDPYRVVRNQTVYALRNLASNPPERVTGVGHLTSILTDADKYLERDGAAWGLGILADEVLLSEFQGSKEEKSQVAAALVALVEAAVNDQEPEVRRVALGTLSDIVSTRAFKDFELDIHLGALLRGDKLVRGLNLDLRAILVCQLHNSTWERQERATKVAIVLAESGQTFWRAMLVQMVRWDPNLLDIPKNGRKGELEQCAKRLGMPRSELKIYVKEQLEKPNVTIQKTATKTLLKINPMAGLRVLKDELNPGEYERSKRQVLAKLKSKRKTAFQTGRLNKSLEALNEILDITWNDKEQMHNKAELYVMMRKFEEATDLTERLRDMKPNDRDDTLYNFFDASVAVLSGEDIEYKKKTIRHLCESANKQVLGSGWRFSVFEDFINENYGEELSKQVDELVRIAKSGKCEDAES